MQTTAETKNLAAALAKAQAAMRPAEMDRVNPHFKNKYATLASIFDACRGPLAANGIAILQGVEAEGASVKVTTTLLHASGEAISSTLTMTATQNNPQGIGSAITYGRRYGLSALVGIVADEDDDANGASEKPKAQARQPATVTPITKGAALDAAPRSIDERKRDLANELTGLGFEPNGIKAFVRDTLGKPTATSPEDMDKLDAALVLVKAQKQADKDADLAY